MNTSALKAFAPAVRKQLIEAVTIKLDFALSATTPDYLDTYAAQVRTLSELATADREGLVERVAYTWFNRLAALRYLDARNWHPFRARVLMAAGAGDTLPELFTMGRTGAVPEELRRYVDVARIESILQGRIPSADPHGETYRMLVLGACRFYHGLLPDVFERLDDETELLLPDDLLTRQSVAEGFRTDIKDEDCEQVEVLGWLYQFYIAEKKDEIMARKGAVAAGDIPARTQLFTPHWIVRTLVENSLGHLWMLNHPDSLLRAWMPYYIERDADAQFVQVQHPQDLRLCDPAAGSGHMLTYAFDLLYVIYEEEGYAPNDIPGLILQNNLHGIEIDARAAQLAALALTLKAREKAPQYFRQDQFVRPKITELRDVAFDHGELAAYAEALQLGELFTPGLLRLLNQFVEAKNLGSLIQPCLSEQEIIFARGILRDRDLGRNLFLHDTHTKVLMVLDQADVLTRRYHFAVTNPPYMGSNSMNGSMKNFAKELYADTKSDTFAMFIDRSFSLVLPGCYSAMVTMQSWMFLDSYEDLRTEILTVKAIEAMIQIGYNSFPEMNSKVALACAFVIKNDVERAAGVYVNLNNEDQAADKEAVYMNRLNAGDTFRRRATDFLALPGRPIAYWISEELRASFHLPKIGEYFTSREGMATADNPRFLRYWFEVGNCRIAYECSSEAESATSGARWFPYNKGGTFQRWYGNNEYVVDWEYSGSRIKGNIDVATGRLRSHNFNGEFGFREGLTWSALTSGPFSIRYCPQGFLFDSKGAKGFGPWLYETLALLNSCVAATYLKVLSPTLDYKVGDIIEIPWVQSAFQPALRQLAIESVAIARSDWDALETSWDFVGSPLLQSAIRGTTIEMSWLNWQSQSIANVKRAQELECNINKILIEAYGLHAELIPHVSEDRITLNRAHERRDMAAFLSYVVGCVMGRYSFAWPGLVLADSGGDIAEFRRKLGATANEIAFEPDEDGVVPVLDGEWFADDVVGRTREFLRATFGERTLRDNVAFIEKALGRDLRSYFLTDFYKDHLQTYKKRPIYWMVQSPRKGFSVLIYLHRYTRDTMNVILNRYLRDYQVKLASRIDHLAQVQTSGSASNREKIAARKESDKLLRTLHECQEWERQTILPLAQARVELDLDDGVKVNYLKLGEALAPIPGFAAAEE